LRKRKQIIGKEQVLQLLKQMKNSSILKDVRIGLTDSFARGTNKKSSDIDILISYETKNNNDLEIYEYILGYMSTNSDYRIDILHLESIMQADAELNTFAISIGLPAIEGNTYEDLLKEVIWVE
jgi:predicted nucleotidyltransferase